MVTLVASNVVEDPPGDVGMSAMENWHGEEICEAQDGRVPLAVKQGRLRLDIFNHRAYLSGPET
jgi:hypothetical protein